MVSEHTMCRGQTKNTAHEETSWGTYIWICKENYNSKNRWTRSSKQAGRGWVEKPCWGTGWGWSSSEFPETSSDARIRPDYTRGPAIWIVFEQYGIPFNIHEIDYDDDNDSFEYDTETIHNLNVSSRPWVSASQFQNKNLCYCEHW